MATTFPWENPSLFSRICLTLPFAKSYSDHLIKRIDEDQRIAESETLFTSFAYLSEHVDAKLEKKIQSLFFSISQDHAQACVHKIIIKSVETHRISVLETIHKVLSLEVLKKITAVHDPVVLAKQEALFVPEPGSQVKKMTHAIVRYLNTHSGIVGKISHYFLQVFSLSYSINFDKPPNNRWDAQSQAHFLREMFQDVKSSLLTVVAFCETKMKVALFAVGAFLSFIGLRYAYRALGFNAPDVLQACSFRNLNSLAKEKGNKVTTLGRSAELNTLEIALSARSGENRTIPILIGEPGVGKTQLVEGLALKIVQGQTSMLNGKQIIAINSADLVGGASLYVNGEFMSRFKALFEEIKGKEDRYILFLDEAHNLVTSKPGYQENILEALKDKLVTHPVQCIFATTQSEYEKTIAKNEAFKSRLTLIRVNPLSEDDTKILLQHTYGQDDDVEINPTAYEKVIELGRDLEESNPRKALKILAMAKNQIHSWIPKKVRNELTEVSATLDRLKSDATHHWIKDKSWPESSEGKALVTRLEELEVHKKTLEAKIKQQDTFLKYIDQLSALKNTYRQTLYSLIHILADSSSGLNPKGKLEAQKRYIYLHSVVIPILIETQKKACLQFEELAHEKIPLEIDVECVERAFEMANVPA